MDKWSDENIKNLTTYLQQYMPGRTMHARYGSAPQGAVHLSYFLRDQLYPGIRDKKRGEGFREAPGLIGQAGVPHSAGSFRWAGTLP